MVEVEDLYRLYERRIIRYIKYAKGSGSKELLPIKSDNFSKFMFTYYYSEYKQLSQLRYSKYKFTKMLRVVEKSLKVSV